MKVYNLLYLTMGLTSLQAADVPSVPTQRIHILNETGQKIELSYRFQDMEIPVAVTLEDKKTIELENTISLQYLTIEPYGRVKGWLSATPLTAGYSQPTNYASHILDKILIASSNDLNMSILLSQGLLGSIRPYNVVIEVAETKSSQNKTMEYNKLLRLFRQVCMAVDSIQKPLPTVSHIPGPGETLPAMPKQIPTIYPRYFLSVPENAQQSDIDAAYNRLMADLNNEKNHAEDNFMKRYWDRIVVHLQTAYDALKLKDGAQEQFEQMINTDLSLGWYSQKCIDPRIFPWS